MLSVLQDSRRSHFKISVLHGVRRLEIGQIGIDHRGTVKADAVETVVNVKFYGVDIG